MSWRPEPKPLLLGYYSERTGLPQAYLRHVRALLTSFAEDEGYCLAGMFGEQAERPATALQALLDSAGRRDVAAVAVPSVTDLGADEGIQQVTRQRLANAGVRVLVLVGGAG